jgi:hypothetical protein
MEIAGSAELGGMKTKKEGTEIADASPGDS